MAYYPDKKKNTDTNKGRLTHNYYQVSNSTSPRCLTHVQQFQSWFKVDIVGLARQEIIFMKKNAYTTLRH